MIRIVSKRDGFRRCGIAHTVAATEYPDDFFDEGQLQALEAEPMLEISPGAGQHPPLAPDPFTEAGVLESAQARASRCALACLDADRGNRGDWTGSGMPQTKTLGAIMGETVSAEIRDGIWKDFGEAAE